MALGFVEQRQVELDSEEAAIVHRGFVTTLRCANPQCNQPVAQVHAMGMVMFRVMCCPACLRATEFENTTVGWTVKLLPKRAGMVPKKRA